MTGRVKNLMLRCLSAFGLAIMLWQCAVIWRDHHLLLAWGMDQVRTHAAVEAASARAVSLIDIDERIASLVAEGDLETAESYAALARSQGAEISPASSLLLEDANSPWQVWPNQAVSFLRGFASGESTNMAELSGAVTSDFLLIGDVRDLALAGIAYGRGQPVDHAVVALAGLGVVLGAGTVWSAGGNASVKVSASLLKRMLRTGRLAPALAREIQTLAARAFPAANLPALFGSILSIKPLAKGPGLRAKLSQVIESHAEPRAWASLKATAHDVADLRGAAGNLGTWRLARHTASMADLRKMAALSSLMGKRTLALEHALGKSILRLAKFGLKSWALFTQIALLMAGFATSTLAFLAGRLGRFGLKTA